MVSVMELLREARAAGLSICSHGDQFVVTGAEILEPLAVRVLGHKREMMVLVYPSDPDDAGSFGDGEVMEVNRIPVTARWDGRRWTLLRWRVSPLAGWWVWGWKLIELLRAEDGTLCDGRESVFTVCNLSRRNFKDAPVA